MSLPNLHSKLKRSCRPKSYRKAFVSSRRSNSCFFSHRHYFSFIIVPYSQTPTASRIRTCFRDASYKTIRRVHSSLLLQHDNTKHTTVFSMPRPPDNYTHAQFESVDSEHAGETVQCLHCRNWTGSVKTLNRKKAHLLNCPQYAQWRAQGNGQDLAPPNKYSRRESGMMGWDDRGDAG